MIKTFTHGPFSVRARCGKGLEFAVCRIDGAKMTVIHFRTWQSDANLDVIELERADEVGSTYVVARAA